MSQRGFTVAPGSIALAAATAKTVLMLIPGSAEPLTIVEFSASLDVATLCLVELVESTQATNGTAGTDFASSVKQLRGFVAGDTTLPSGLGVRHTFTSEPTVLTPLKYWWFNGPGPLVIQAPLSREIQSLVSGATKYKGIGFRLTTTLASNCRVYADIDI